MSVSLTNISEQENNTLKFTLSGLNVSLANAIRRTILSDIPVVGIYTQTYKGNQCVIEKNTCRLHNEILKQRLSCIPIHSKNMETLPGNYVLEVENKNDTDNMMYITTEDFKIKNKQNDNYLTKEETRKIFPPNDKTNMFIDFTRLRPKISNTIPGEELKLAAEFSVHKAKEDSMYNVVSKCSYGNTPDMEKVEASWKEMEQKLRSEELSQDEIDFQKRNFYLLDAQKYYKEDSFDFVIQTIGIYENKEILLKACDILKDKFQILLKSINSDTLSIVLSETTMENSYDIILVDEDYTIGKVLEYFIYDNYFIKDQVVLFCGFKKFHPHDDSSKIRVAFKEKVDKQMVGEYLRKVCNQAVEFYNEIKELFT
jgi:DNA-directed RNA polymerase alpha subunit